MEAFKAQNAADMLVFMYAFFTLVYDCVMREKNCIQFSQLRIPMFYIPATRHQRAMKWFGFSGAIFCHSRVVNVHVDTCSICLPRRRM